MSSKRLFLYLKSFKSKLIIKNAKKYFTILKSFDIYRDIERAKAEELKDEESN